MPGAAGSPSSERLLRPVIFRKARKSRAGEDGRALPGAARALDAVRARHRHRRSPRGCRLEARHFGELAVSDVSRALVSVFFATQDIKKDAGYPEGTQAREVHKLGVLGAGLMGAGIAAAAAEAGVAVRIKDATHEALGRGLRHAREVFDERRKRRQPDRARGAQAHGPPVAHASTTAASAAPTW